MPTCYEICQQMMSCNHARNNPNRSLGEFNINFAPVMSKMDFVYLGEQRADSENGKTTQGEDHRMLTVPTEF